MFGALFAGRIKRSDPPNKLDAVIIRDNTYIDYFIWCRFNRGVVNRGVVKRGVVLGRGRGQSGRGQWVGVPSDAPHTSSP